MRSRFYRVILNEGEARSSIITHKNRRRKSYGFSRNLKAVQNLTRNQAHGFISFCSQPHIFLLLTLLTACLSRVTLQVA